MKFCIALLTLMVSNNLNALERGWYVHTHNNEYAVIIESNQTSSMNIKDALISISPKVCLKHFRIGYQLDKDIELQSELHAFLLKNHSKLYSEALDSTGNMHNPKVIALHQAFNKALLSTSLVSKLNSALSARNEQILSVSFEKFTVNKSAANTQFNAIVWLSTDACSEH
ncbi:hypothetical protein [Kangiella sp. HZ709]|uniref:hypothetical protein n=1 Tax=Kangiella sp. HZ709 TaxID=2666328 RepID=UPI0012AF1DCD|nr:hypothetical protein [Kangiella sp. HZ709]MRX28654.1 hypothetical protein [Kangiella sp. HZ709]